jgi:hypothetical protein
MKALPKVVLLGVPESGLHLLNELMLHMTPLFSGNWINQWEEDIYNTLNKTTPGEVRAGYIYYTHEMQRWLDENRMLRFFIYRDPRDMILATLFFIMNEDHKHLHYRYFSEHLKSTEERLLKLITGFNEPRSVAKHYGIDEIGYGNINHYYIRYLNWLHDPKTCVVRYEDLVRDKSSLRHVMNRMVDYVWNDIDVQLTGMTRTEYIRKYRETPLSQAFQQSPPGEWKAYFTEEIKCKFKEVAGELLSFLGYERDGNW